ncbi:hypothetical protein [Rhodoferax fermentans]|uniref:hypothetical protein n=1 Tax=Rhodoferax fermentans TaxID=28066 RepID=UPI001301FA78|nr:hypothetical protein [Rhodoferax fermentans]
MIDAIREYFAGHPVAYGILIGVLVRHTLGSLFQSKVGKEKACNGKSRVKYIP